MLKILQVWLIRLVVLKVLKRVLELGRDVALREGEGEREGLRRGGGRKTGVLLRLRRGMRVVVHVGDRERSGG